MNSCIIILLPIPPLLTCPLSTCLLPSFAAVRFQADNWNKYRNMCAKEIGTKMKRKDPVGDDDSLSQEIIDKLHAQTLLAEDLKVGYNLCCSNYF